MSTEMNAKYRIAKAMLLFLFAALATGIQTAKKLSHQWLANGSEIHVKTTLISAGDV